MNETRGDGNLELENEISPRVQGEGIKRQWTVPNTPFNKMWWQREPTGQKARCRRLHAGLPHWSDAVVFATYLINRSPHKSRNSGLPPAPVGG